MWSVSRHSRRPAFAFAIPRSARGLHSLVMALVLVLPVREEPPRWTVRLQEGE